jgi:hypothetical protein
MINRGDYMNGERKISMGMGLTALCDYTYKMYHTGKYDIHNILELVLNFNRMRLEFPLDECYVSGVVSGIVIVLNMIDVKGRG